MNKLRSAFATLVAFLGLSISIAAWAAGDHCNVCGMMIPENAKNHIVLRAEQPEQKILHICSIGCLKKATKQGQKGKTEFADFNNPKQMIAGDKAFFLVGSSKIKPDFGDMAMAPYVAAFSTKKDADAAATKYGDGKVVQGLDAALK